jgi:hypothetical protein
MSDKLSDNGTPNPRSSDKPPSRRNPTVAVLATANLTELTREELAAVIQDAWLPRISAPGGCLAGTHFPT